MWFFPFVKPLNRTIQFLVWGFLVAVILGIGVAYVRSVRTPVRPVLPALGQVPAFVLTNQIDRAVSESALNGKIWVANIIFTRCGGPCPRLSGQMREIQDAFPAATDVQFVSLTSDPEFDTPAVLREYADRFKADPRRWSFLTGTKQAVYGLAIQGLRFTVVDNKEKGAAADEDLFIHSLRFVVIDGEGTIRAYLDGGETNSVSRVIETVQTLMQEVKSK